MPHTDDQREQKKTTSKRPAHRPRKEVDINRVRQLAKGMLTDKEIAFQLGIGQSTFKAKKAENPAIEEAIEEGKAATCGSLRAMQIKVAMQGNVRMLIHLGKQYLGQKDKVEHSGDTKSPCTVEPMDQEEFKKKYPTMKDLWAALDAQLGRKP